MYGMLRSHLHDYVCTLRKSTNAVIAVNQAVRGSDKKHLLSRCAVVALAIAAIAISVTNITHLVERNITLYKTAGFVEDEFRMKALFNPRNYPACRCKDETAM
jgi:hypothetical protein